MWPQCGGHLNVLGGQHPAIAEGRRKVLPGIAPVPGNLAGNKSGATRLIVRPLGLKKGPITSRGSHAQMTYDYGILAPARGIPDFREKPAEQDCRQQSFGIQGQRLQVFENADDGILRSATWSDVSLHGLLDFAATASAAMVARTQGVETGDWFSGARPFAAGL